MDLVIGLLWFVAFSVIVLFLGALNYFLGRSYSDINITENKSRCDIINQQQSTRNNNRRKHARNANKKRQQAAAVVINDNLNSDNNNEDKQEIESISSEIKNDEEEEASSIHPTDEEKEEFEDPMTIEEVLTPSSPPSIQGEQKPILSIKQRNKNKSNHMNSKSSSTPSISSKEELILPIKPQASVAPIKQLLPINSTINIESTQIRQDKNSKSNGKFPSSCNIYSYSEQNSIPPRFQQRQQKETTNVQKFRQRKTKKSSITIQNDFLPSISKQQINNNHHQFELSNQNGYSSESDILTESSSTAPPLSTESQSSDLKRSLSPSNIFLDELVSIFDTTSFSKDDLQLILNKISTKHLSNKQDRQHLCSATTTNEKTIEQILDETYRSETKILAIELQTEKNRVLELSKINAEMDNTIRQFQQPNNNMISYQQTILSYHMQIRRLTDENARLIHQLHVYSTMPASINELKQQQIFLNEQLRQINIRNSNLEKEIADGERAVKHAAEIYKKADIQKEERIEQMMIDINKYKKIEKDLNTFQIKHSEFEKSCNLKLNNLIHQRDELQKTCEQLKEKIQEYEQFKINYDQLQTSNSDQLQQELNETKAKNDILRQRNWKIMEQLNKLSHEQK